MRLPVATKVTVLVVLAIAVTFAAATGLAWRSGSSVLRHEAIEGTGRKLDGYLAGVEQYLDRSRELLALAGAHLAPAPSGAGPGLGAGETPGAVVEGLLAASPVFGHVDLLDREGASRLLRPGAVLERQPATVRAAAWFRAALGGSPAVGDLELSPVDASPTIVVAVPVRGGAGEVTGVLAGGLALPALSRMGVEPGGRPARQAHGYVTDSHGLVIAHQARPEYVRDQTDFSSVASVREALGGRSGASFHWNAVERQRKVAAYAPLPGTGWAVVFASPEREAMRSLGTMTGRLLTGAAVAGVLCSAAAAVAARRLLAPIRRLSTAAARVAAGDLDVRVGGRGRDDLADLGRQFDRMASALAAHQVAIDATMRDLGAAVAQRDLTVVELDSFAYSVSHDLRAPLRAIEGFTASIAATAGPSLDERSLDDLGRVQRATRRMGELIDDLLRLSRISRTPLEPVDVDLSALAGDVCARLAEAEPGRDVAVTIEPGLHATGDAGLLHVVLEQLIGNAWKFTGRTDRARVCVGRGAGAAATFVVGDNGAGFDPRYADKLFAPFQRLHPTPDFPGSGIGLATVQRIVARHGGRVAAEGAVGAGARFSFTIPERNP